MGHQLVEFVNNQFIVHLIILEILLQNYVFLIALLLNKLMLIMIQRDVINFVHLVHLLITLHINVLLFVLHHPLILAFNKNVMLLVLTIPMLIIGQGCVYNHFNVII